MKTVLTLAALAALVTSPAFAGGASGGVVNKGGIVVSPYGSKPTGGTGPIVTPFGSKPGTSSGGGDMIPPRPPTAPKPK